MPPPAGDVPHPVPPEKGQSRVKSEGEPVFMTPYGSWMLLAQPATRPRNPAGFMLQEQTQ